MEESLDFTSQILKKEIKEPKRSDKEKKEIGKSDLDKYFSKTWLANYFNNSQVIYEGKSKK